MKDWTAVDYVTVREEKKGDAPCRGWQSVRKIFFYLIPKISNQRNFYDYLWELMRRF